MATIQPRQWAMTNNESVRRMMMVMAATKEDKGGKGNGDGNEVACNEAVEGDNKKDDVSDKGGMQ